MEVDSHRFFQQEAYPRPPFLNQGLPTRVKKSQERSRLLWTFLMQHICLHLVLLLP